MVECVLYITLPFGHLYPSILTNISYIAVYSVAEDIPRCREEVGGLSSAYML